MKFTTKTRNLPKDFKQKFYFVDGDESSGVELWFISDEEMREERKKYIKTLVEYVHDPKTGKLTRVETEKADTEAFITWWITSLISDFWGVIADDTPLEVTAYTKQALFFGSNFDEATGKFTSVIDEERAFNKFVIEKNAELHRNVIELFGGTSKGKNSLSTQ